MAFKSVISRQTERNFGNSESRKLKDAQPAPGRHAEVEQVVLEYM